MAHYIQMAEDEPRGVWLVEEAGARRIDVTGVSFPPRPGEEMLSVLKSSFPAAQFHALKLPTGRDHPRMARPHKSPPHQSPRTNPAKHEQQGLTQTGEENAQHAHQGAGVGP